MELQFKSGGEKCIKTIPESIVVKSSYLNAYKIYNNDKNIIDIDQLGYTKKIFDILIDICNNIYEYEIYVSNQIKKIKSNTKKLNSTVLYNLELKEYEQLVTLATYLDIDYVITTLRNMFDTQIQEIGIFCCSINISGYDNDETDNILDTYPTFCITKYILMNITHYYNICDKLKLLDRYKQFIKDVNSKSMCPDYVTDISELEKIKYQKTDIVTKINYNGETFCINSFKVIIKKFNQYTNNYFKNLNYNNMIISGGFMYGIVDNLYDSLSCTGDIDIFVYGNSDEKNQKITYLLEYFSQYKPIYFVSNGTYNILIPELKFDIQIINSKYNTPANIVEHFDYGYTQLFYDGEKIFCTNKCLYSLLTKITCIFKSGTNDLNKNISRIEKAYTKGLEITDIHDYIKLNKLENINFSFEYIPNSLIVRQLIKLSKHNLFSIIKNVYQVTSLSYNYKELYIDPLYESTYLEGSLDDIHSIIEPEEDENINRSDPVLANVKFYNKKLERIFITDVITIKKSDVRWFKIGSLTLEKKIKLSTEFNLKYPPYSRITDRITMDLTMLKRIKYANTDKVFKIKLMVSRKKLLYTNNLNRPERFVNEPVRRYSNIVYGKILN